MLYNTLHNRALRLGLAVAGELITAAGINLFIVSPSWAWISAPMTSPERCTSSPTSPS